MITFYKKCLVSSRMQIDYDLQIWIEVDFLFVFV